MLMEVPEQKRFLPWDFYFLGFNRRNILLERGVRMKYTIVDIGRMPLEFKSDIIKNNILYSMLID